MAGISAAHGGFKMPRNCQCGSVPQRPKSKSSTKKTHPTTETEPSKASVMKSSGKAVPSAIEVDGDVDEA